MNAIASTGRFRRPHGQSPRVLMVGAAESAPQAGQRGCVAPKGWLIGWIGLHSKTSGLIQSEP